MNVIDFRVRVPFGSFLKAGFYSDIPKREQVARDKYNMHLPQSVYEGSMETLLKEMDELNIVKAVVPARKAFHVENSEMVEFLKLYGDRFIAFAAASADDPQKALEEIDAYVVNGPCHGVVIEPGYDNVKMAANDERMYPIYEKLQEHDIPLMLGWGGMLYRSMDIYKPEQLDQVAIDFPNLRILAAHGGWPYVTEMTWMALIHKNLYLMPDLYMYNTPGMLDYAMAANTVNKDKIIFGSAYPIVSQAEAVHQYLNCGIQAEFIENVMYNNALKFLKVDDLSQI